MSPPSEAPDSPEQGSTEQPSSQRTAGVVEEDLSMSAGPRVLLWLRFGATVVLFVSILGVAAHAVNSEQERLAVAGVEAGALTWLYGLALLYLAVVFLPGMVTDTGRVTRVLTRLRRRRIAVASVVSLLVLVAAGSLFPFGGAETRTRPVLSLQPPVWGETSEIYLAGCEAEIVDGMCEGTMRFPLGTNPSGEDLLTKSLLGLNTSLQVAVTATVIAATLGIAVGAVAGYAGGRTDEVLMRYVDVQRSIPAFFVYVLLLLVFDRNYALLILVFGLLSWGGIARTVRGEVRQRREAPYMQAVEISGAGASRILSRHVLPNVSNTVVTGAAVLFAKFVLFEASLGFLSLTDPVVPSLGNEIARSVGRETGDPIGEGFTSVRWDWARHLHIVAVPAGILCWLLLSVSVLSDALRDVLDPRA